MYRVQVQYRGASSAWSLSWLLMDKSAWFSVNWSSVTKYVDSHTITKSYIDPEFWQKIDKECIHVEFDTEHIDIVKEILNSEELWLQTPYFRYWKLEL